MFSFPAGASMTGSYQLKDDIYFCIICNSIGSTGKYNCDDVLPTRSTRSDGPPGPPGAIMYVCLDTTRTVRKEKIKQVDPDRAVTMITMESVVLVISDDSILYLIPYILSQYAL